MVAARWCEVAIDSPKPSGMPVPAPGLGCAVFATAIGDCAIAWGGRGITAVQLPEASAAATLARMRCYTGPVPEAMPPSAVGQVIGRLVQLLAGAQTVPDDLSDVVLDMGELSEFHQRVYALARRIPPGRTMTYGEMARALDAPGAARAVGQALGHNPFAPLVPCHRILAASGGSGGFSAHGGIRTKLRLLEIEGARFGAPGLFDAVP